MARKASTLTSGSAGVSGKSRQSRNAAGLIVSLFLHVLLIGIIINQQPPEYRFAPSDVVPEPLTPAPEPAMDVRIMKLPLVPPKVQPSPQPAPPLPVAQPMPPQPTPPAPQPPQPPTPQPVVPEHPTILPPTPPAPAPPVPAPTQAAPRPLPAPTPQPSIAKPAPAPRPTPAPAVPVTAAPPAPVQTQPKPAAAPKVAAPSALNIHKAAQPVPTGVPTLPLAPAAGAAGAPGAPPSGSPAAGAPGGSRLNGLNPYPYGFMPSGGGGLRGTLIGCANAEAVHLSSVERDKCNERFGVDVAGAPKLDPLSPAKRAAFDKAAASDAAWQKYRDSTAGAAGPGMPGGIDHGPASSVILDHPASDYPPK
jgi:hypothetical protein